LTCRDIGGNHGPLLYETVSADEFQDKNENINRNDSDGDDRTMYGATGDVA
jgi:hypothetical protein